MAGSISPAKRTTRKQAHTQAFESLDEDLKAKIELASKHPLHYSKENLLSAPGPRNSVVWNHIINNRHAALVVAKSSIDHIHAGLGVYAAQDIDENGFVCTYEGTFLTPQQYGAVKDEYENDNINYSSNYIIEKQNKSKTKTLLVMDGSKKLNFGPYINAGFGDEANIVLVLFQHPTKSVSVTDTNPDYKRYGFYARRFIPKGTELFWEYGDPELMKQKF